MISMEQLKEKIGHVFYFATVEDGAPRVRVRGKAVMDDRPEVQTAMYEAGPFLKETYNEETGHYHMCFYLEGMSAMEFKGPEAIRLV